MTECPGSVLVVDKPDGPTSHDVVAKVRRLLRTKHVGHCGTLDPMATGVLVLAVGDATKLVPWLTVDDKAYEATIAFGVATDTLDAKGSAAECVPPGPELVDALAATARGAESAQGSVALPQLLAAALNEESQRTWQMPPAFSAIRIAGERAHTIARRGETPTLAARECAVRRLRALGAGLEPVPHLRVSVEVTKGYFVRSLARDLSAALGTVGHLTQLRRTRSGVFTLDDAIALDRPIDEIRTALIPVALAAVRALPVSVLSDEGVRAAGFGQRLMPAQIRDPHERPSAWVNEAGMLIAVGRVDPDGSGQVLRGFFRP